MPHYALVLVADSGSHAFDYEVPEAVAGTLQVGSRVRVPVRTTTKLGTIIEIRDTTAAKGVRPIADVIDPEPVLNPIVLRMAVWMSDYYCCSIEAAMRAVLPKVIRKGELGHKQRLVARLARELSKEEVEAIKKRAPVQGEILECLAESAAPVPVTELAAHAVVQALVRKGLVIIEPVKFERDPFAKEEFVGSQNLELNEEQAVVFARVKASLESPSSSPPTPLLLHGITGSGKTEIYLQSIQLVLERGQGAIMLVPEISLTPQTVERFKSRFAATQSEVAVLHSHLSEGERHDEWHKIRAGRARIVIGARSAVFAPVAKLGLIVVDEEHENSYKQEETPRYHGRDLAVLRAQMEGCPCLLGSATPSLESYHNALSGKYELLRLTLRIDDRQLPFIRIVDMRNDAKRKGSILSERLITAIEQRLQRKEQSILFLNRRGFSTSLLCEQCGYVHECENCSVSLTFHRAAGRVVCHTCGFQAVAPQKCPQCKSPGIRYSGVGTEKVEDNVSALFPEATIKRLDADVMQKKDAFRETLDAFRRGQVDILVGTQMIAKGLHFPNVTLVGIINADLGLHMPDFRAGERTFQLLTQVAGRAGRGDVEGEVLVQSYTPHSPSIQFARHHDFEGFWEQESEWRRNYDWPPCTHLILINVRSAHQARAQLSAETLARRLREDIPAGATISEPAPAPLEKSHGQYRFHLVLRSRSVRPLSRHIRSVLDRLPMPEDVIVTVDVDAYQLL
jgi:primosomal protein N' (replication factor Y) (superfamily II helicase)